MNQKLQATVELETEPTETPIVVVATTGGHVNDVNDLETVVAALIRVFCGNVQMILLI